VRFDMVVVGAGHAGCEAAAAAARLGLKVALVSHSRQHVARLSCNPAIGGLGKGHLVRELDALGGLMGRVADAACIQFRRLNTRKGLAVQSSRAQVDIDVYPVEMQGQLARLPRLTLVEGEVAALRFDGERAAGVVLADGTALAAPRVVLTTGTFLGGVMHRGEQQTIGGRIGDGAAHALAVDLRARGLRVGRLKTGTVPRLDRRSIDWGRVARQDDTVPEGRFSFADVPRRLPQIDCHLTWTNARTHAIIRAALHRSPMYTGQIEGRGPRYCPSVEDKVVRFADKERHLLFLEPEGHGTERVYVNGISTSLPVEVQDELVRSIEGLERAVILQHGYAVEYDHIDPTDLDRGLQHRAFPGLFFAGQINGTSGYEEAAVQGFVAGVSAATGAPLVLGRDEAYIGVLVDDLTSRGIGGEPYRMLTSRAEHRLLLREDNADRRLMPRGRELGLVDDPTWAAFEAREEQRAAAVHALTRDVLPDAALAEAFEARGWAVPKRPVTAEELLRRPEVTWSTLAEVVGLPDLDARVAEQVEIDVKYEGYVNRAAKRAEQAGRMEHVALPMDLDWRSMRALSTEVRERLTRARPETLGQLARVPGITPAAVGVVVDWLARARGGPEGAALPS
jgi:tRNA uridine 5-carboxymethylaminomethyl modification enzyme